MSLINDALKRARQHQAQRPPQSPVGAPLQPVERHPSGGLGRMVYPALLVATLVFGGWALWKFLQASAPKSSGAGLTAPVQAEPVLAKVPAPQPEPERSPAVVHADPPARPVVQVNTTLVTRVTAPAASPASANPPAPISTPATVPPAETSAPQTAAAPPVAAPAPATPPVTTPVAAAGPPSAAPAAARPAETKPVLVTGTFPDLHLQAIFYRLKKPSVMINGRTYYTGEMIGDAQLTKIERDHVVVTRQGEARHLNLR